MIINELIHTRYDACAAGQLPPHCMDGKTEAPVDRLRIQNPCTSEPLASSEGSLHTWTPEIKPGDRERPEIAFSIKQPISVFNYLCFFGNLSCGNSRSVQQTVPALHFGVSSWLIKSIDITLPRVLYSQSYGFSSSHVWM